MSRPLYTVSLPEPSLESWHFAGSHGVLLKSHLFLDPERNTFKKLSTDIKDLETRNNKEVQSKKFTIHILFFLYSSFFSPWKSRGCMIIIILHMQILISHSLFYLTSYAPSHVMMELWQPAFQMTA